jgi:hypothetical protein
VGEGGARWTCFGSPPNQTTIRLPVLLRNNSEHQLTYAKVSISAFVFDDCFTTTIWCGLPITEVIGLFVFDVH